ncbi:MAG: hypothetical protein JOZ68_04350 [Acidimicrobiia bacterium]|nr:hypothetical protein [Acidimicrobiia bacterium]
MRLETELLLADADLIGTDRDEQRTQEQRTFDALFELVCRVADSTAVEWRSARPIR